MNIQKLDFSSLDFNLKKSLEKLISEKKYLPCLEGKNPNKNGQLLGFAVFKEDKPVDLLLGNFVPVLKYGQIYFLSSSNPSLILKLEEDLKSLSCLVVSYLYKENEQVTKTLEQLHWSKPKKLIMHCHFYSQKFNPYWLHHSYLLPEGMTFFPWNELTQEERKNLLYKEQQGSFPISISPFGDEEKDIEPINSLGLRYKDQVIGWVITHRIDKDTISYSAFYVDKEFRNSSIPLFLLTESMKRHIASKIPLAILNLNLEQSQARWNKFIQKRLLSEAFQVSYSYYSWKNLS